MKGIVKAAWGALIQKAKKVLAYFMPISADDGDINERSASTHDLVESIPDNCSATSGSNALHQLITAWVFRSLTKCMTIINPLKHAIFRSWRWVAKVPLALHLWEVWNCGIYALHYAAANTVKPAILDRLCSKHKLS